MSTDVPAELAEQMTYLQRRYPGWTIRKARGGWVASNPDYGFLRSDTLDQVAERLREFDWHRSAIPDGSLDQ